MSQNLAQDTRFPQTRFRTGYAADEINLFVRAAEDARRSPSPQLDASAVARHLFTPVMDKPGDRTDDVDYHLEEPGQLRSERGR